jgi:hypothetical protein
MSTLNVDQIGHSTSGTTAIEIDSSGRVDMNASYVFDQWYLNAHHTTNGDSDITAWSQVAWAGTGKVSGMSHSSGIFTFPQTGLYKVTFQQATRSDASDNMSGQVHVTTDNSTYNSVLSVSGGDSGSVNGTATGSVFINVTDVSNVKVKLRATSMDTASYVIGNSTTTTTNVMFERVAPAQ